MIDLTGPQRVLEEPEPRRAHEPRPELEDAAPAARSRRRVGWRKGSDVDEEMWPAAAFGGVSDEQFWDDLAADKPLATTARTAQPETGPKRRPPNAGPLPDLYPAAGRGRADDRTRADDRGRADGRYSPADGPGTHPQPRLDPDDRTAIQPALTGLQPPPAATQPVRTVQSARASHQPAEPRGRTRAGADDDPLTSPAYSLRPKGSVDGRGYLSSRRPGDASPAAPQYSANGHERTDGYRTGPQRTDPLRSDPLRSDPIRSDPLRSGDGYGRTVPGAAYPYPQPPYGEPSQSTSTPAYEYEYPAGSRGQGLHGAPAGPGGPGGDPRRASGGWGPGQADGGWGSRPDYPPVNGHRGPQDARGYDRRLTSRAH